jgi:micrococcal nuclease
MWEYRATVQRWLDGDTLDVEIDLGFYVLTNQRLRLVGSGLGIDTPEKNAADPAVRERAARATARCWQLAPATTPVILRTQKPAVPKDGFGRFLAEVVIQDGRSLGDVLLEEGLAVPYQRAR